MKKTECPICGKLVTNNNIGKHIKSHETHPKYQAALNSPYKLDHDDLFCKFCGKECKNANSLRNHERLCKQNPNRQISELVIHMNKPDYQVWNKGLDKTTDSRVNKQATSLKTYYENNPGPWLGKKHTEEQKIKIGKSVKKFLEANPEMVPYKKNHSSKESYPEKYFNNIFNSEGLLLEREFPIKSYKLDFCDPIKKVDIEIDGELHYVDEKMIEHDLIRNKILEDLDWKICRIRWSHFKSMSDKLKLDIIFKIKSLLQ